MPYSSAPRRKVRNSPPRVRGARGARSAASWRATWAGFVDHVHGGPCRVGMRGLVSVSAAAARTEGRASDGSRPLSAAGVDGAQSLPAGAVAAPALAQRRRAAAAAAGACRAGLRPASRRCGAAGAGLPSAGRRGAAAGATGAAPRRRGRNVADDLREPGAPAPSGSRRRRRSARPARRSAASSGRAASTAPLTWPMPSLCSAAAALISPMMSVTRCTLATISFIVAAGVGDQPRAGLDLVDLAPIRPLISLAASARALRQAAHFAGDDREAAALFAGARGFDRGVQRQDVGLERDAVDDADDVGDLLRAGVDLVHRRDDLRRRPRRRAAATSAAERRAGWPGAAESARLLDGAGELLHRRWRSAAGCSPVCSVRWLRSCVAGGDLGRWRCDAVGRLPHLADHAAQRCLHVRQRAQQLRRLRRGRRVPMRLRQVAAGDRLRGRAPASSSGAADRAHVDQRQRRRSERPPGRRRREEPERRHAGAASASARLRSRRSPVAAMVASRRAMHVCLAGPSSLSAIAPRRSRCVELLGHRLEALGDCRCELAMRLALRRPLAAIAPSSSSACVACQRLPHFCVRDASASRS